MNSQITYNSILSYKNNFIINQNIIDTLQKVVLNITEISNKISFTTSKHKTYTKADGIPPENKIISLLNLLTESNKSNILNKILDLDLDELVLEKCILNFHKKLCLEHHFFENYIYLIKNIILSGVYNFNKNKFWKLFIAQTQNTFNNINNLDPDNNELFSGNLILIFYLCRERLLSLTVLPIVFKIIKNKIESNDILVNILFSTLDCIPLHYKYNDILLENINDLLKLKIPFRLKFKLEELSNSITKFNNTNISNKTKDKTKDNTEISNKTKGNIDFENLIISFIKKYIEKSCNKTLEKSISNITNFRKSYFFKIFIFNIIKIQMDDKIFKSLLKFIYNRKYRPNNYKNILFQINKNIKKLNNTQYTNKLSLIIN
jgi:hypothetical protein